MTEIDLHRVGAHPPSGDGDGAGDSIGLKPTLGTRLLFLMVVGDILGAGIYILVGDVAGDVGGMAWLAFAGAFAIAALSATSYAELVTRYPGAAGSALYVDRAAGRATLTFAVGMAVMLSSLMTAATTARAFAGDYLAEFVDAPVPLVAAGLIVVLTVLNIVGIEASARANVVMTVVEVGGLVAVLVIGGAAIADGGGDTARLVSTDDLTLGGLLGATAIAFFAFLGFEDATHLSEEVADVRRTFPRVLFAAVATAAILYLLVAVVATVAVDPALLAASDGPLLEVVDRGPLAVSPRWFAVVALVAVTNTCLFALVASSRILYGMSSDGHAPAEFGRVLPTRRTPFVAAGAMAVGGIAMALTGAVSELAEAAVTLLLGVLTAVNLSAWATRSRPEAEAAYRAPMLVAPVGALACGVLVGHQLLTASADDLLRLAAVVGASLALWLAARIRAHRAPPR